MIGSMDDGGEAYVSAWAWAAAALGSSIVTHSPEQKAKVEQQSQSPSQYAAAI